MPKLHHLRDFVAIANAKSVRSAARSIGLAQPVLTRSLQELERELGVSLFERHVRGMALTASGERFLMRAQAALEEVRRGCEEAGQLQGRMQGNVSVALSGALMMTLLPAAYGDFRKACPDVSLRLVEGLFPAVEPRLRDGRLDFYMGPRPERALGGGYQVQLLFKNERMVLARKGHPLAREKTLERLLDADWIVVGLRERVEEEFEEQFSALGMRNPKLLTIAESMLGLIALLSTTDALALLPRQWAESTLFKDVIEPIKVREPLIGPDIVEVTRAKFSLTPAAEKFATLLRRAAAQRARRN
jgi:LysR family transcriptional regulator of abg operon